jgi:hypothetical protein
MLNCPKCQSALLQRSRSRTVFERCRKALTARRLFRCRECGWRGWALPTERGVGIDNDADDPDLQRLDSLEQPRQPEPLE